MTGERYVSEGVTWAVRLRGTGEHATRVGSKAAALDRLIAAGFEVPPAIVVTADAYRAFVAASGLDGFIADIADRPVPPPALADRWKAEVEEAFLGAEMPSALVDAIDAARTELGGGPLAVRSSSSAEDLEGASFAGQYRSLLGTETRAEVLEAVRLVWASLWLPWVSAYRRQMGIGEEGLTMAALMQPMVRAERSGVVFTSDPSQRELLRLEVVDGLGELLVSGEVTPDVYQLRRHSLRCISGEEIDPLLREAAHTALRIEERLGGGPQDVEWTTAGGKVWVLQARPITTLDLVEDPSDGFDTRPRPGDLYVPAGVTEMLPGVLSPLSWSINGPMVEEAFRGLFDRLGALPALDGSYGFIGRRRGRARLNLSAVQRAAGRMAGWSPADVQRLYLGAALVEEAADADTGRSSRLRTLTTAVRAMRVRMSAARSASAFVGAAAAARASAPDPAGLLDRELVALRWRLRDLASWGMRSEIAVAAVAVAAYRGLEQMLEGWIGDEAAAMTQRLTADAARGVPTAAAIAADLAAGLDDARRIELHRMLEAGAGPQVALDAAGAGKELAEEITAAIVRLGSAAIYAGPTWAERPDALGAVLDAALALGARAGHGEDPAAELAALERRLKRTTRWRLQRLITGQVVDMRIRMLRRLVGDARSLLNGREAAKAALLAVGGLEREVIVEAGRRLSATGLLDEPGDVVLLADWELDQALLERAVPPSSELERRQRVLERWSAETPSSAIPTGVEDADTLQGWGAGPGTHRGEVRVLLDPSDAADIPPGSVVVAPATDPSWILVFQRAGALVVERGGPLSHAAIVAREFGLPAVLNIPGATRLLGDGEWVEVDGDRGVVNRLRRAAAEPSDELEREEP